MKLSFILNENNNADNSFEEMTFKTFHGSFHKTFANCAKAAVKMAQKKGYQISSKDFKSEVIQGGRYKRAEPSAGKTHEFRVGLLKRGRPVKNMLIFQVYSMNSIFELTAYIS